MGPGTAGASTAAAALATNAASHGSDVLLVMTDRAPVTEVLTGNVEVDERDRTVFRDGGRLRVRSVSTSRVFSERLGQSGLGGMFRRALSGPSLPLISAAVSGLNDLLTLGGIVELEQRDGADLIVVDTPGSGRAFEFLHGVERACELIQSPELVECALDVQTALGDSARFEGVPVTAPDAGRIRVVAQMVTSLRASKELAVSTLVANAIWPAEAVTARAAQRHLIEELTSDLGVNHVEFPWFPDGVTSRGDVHDLAARIEVAS